MSERIQRRIEEIEEMLNWVSDQDREWWPFLFLRPAQNQPMTTTRVALLAALHGIFAGMLANLAVALLGSASKVNVFTLPLLTTLGFFIIYRFTFAYSWNRRARRLTAQPVLD